MLKKIFIYAQTFWAFWKYPPALKKMWTVWENLFFTFIIYPQKKCFCCCPPFEVLSHMKVNMLGKTALLEALVNMKAYFKLLESRV
jgi:hypothetical protein